MRDTFAHSNAKGLSDGQVEVRWENGRPTMYESAIGEVTLSDGTILSRASKEHPVVIRDDKTGITVLYTHRPKTGWSSRKMKRKLTWHSAPITPGPDTVTRIGALEADRFGNLRIGNLWFDAKGAIDFKREAFAIIRRANGDDNTYIRSPDGEVLILTYGRCSWRTNYYWWVRTYAEVTEEEVVDGPYLSLSVIIALLGGAVFSAFLLFTVVRIPVELLTIIAGSACIGGAVRLFRWMTTFHVRTPDIPNFDAG